jgi:hypothetical protein
MHQHVRVVLQVATFWALLAVAGLAGNRVLVVGIDGAGGSYTHAAHTPHLDSLAAAGGVRYDFLNEGALVVNPPQPYGASGVNWSTLNTGVSAASHGVADNTFLGHHFDEFPHWFKYVKDHDPTRYTASIVNWAPINEHIVPNEYADLELEFDEHPFERHLEDAAIRDAVVGLLSTADPDAIFVHFDQVDAAGHRHGWGSPEFTASIETVDSLIGDIIDAVNARPGVASGDEDWLVMVTADHGGGRGEFVHRASQGPINWEVPLIISGPSVPDGVMLPQGTLRDIAPTALWHLGIDPRTTPMEGHVVGVPYAAVPEPSSHALALLAIFLAAYLHFR